MVIRKSETAEKRLAICPPKGESTEPLWFVREFNLSEIGDRQLGFIPRIVETWESPSLTILIQYLEGWEHTPSFTFQWLEEWTATANPPTLRALEDWEVATPIINNQYMEGFEPEFTPVLQALEDWEVADPTLQIEFTETWEVGTLMFNTQYTETWTPTVFVTNLIFGAEEWTPTDFVVDSTSFTFTDDWEPLVFNRVTVNIEDWEEYTINFTFLEDWEDGITVIIDEEWSFPIDDSFTMTVEEWAEDWETSPAESETLVFGPEPWDFPDEGTESLEHFEDWES
jgi:hypothetical protein